MGKPAARVGDMHTCPVVDPGPKPHVGGPVLPPGCPTVLIGGQPAARIGDMAMCVGPPDTIVVGSPTVFIGGKPAARLGDSTAHGGVILSPGLPTVLIGEASVKFGPGPITPVAAQELMAIMSQQEDIAFKFPADGCYARAHLMTMRMEQLGATPGKAWTFAKQGDPLWVSTPNHPQGKVSWGYHVAPTVEVMKPNGTVEDRVIDPSLSEKPMTVDEWVATQHDSPTVIQTDIGEPPIPARGGSGYWPGPDPLEGPDVHALETMEEYKLHQGTGWVP